MSVCLDVFFQLLTRFAGWVARQQAGVVTVQIIRWFVGRYGVNMNEALHSDIAHFTSFNEFFTRELKPGLRPLAIAPWLCPVDGVVSQWGRIDQGQMVQAKGHVYSAQALLGGDAQLAAPFEHGSFATLYLAPKDYHRIHMPCQGRLVRMVYVPGTLFSVNPRTAQTVPGLFARNERVVCVFESARGPFVLVLVGATIVGSVATTWHGVVNVPRRREVSEWRYDQHQITLQQGDEMGRFLLGSTVVMLSADPSLQFNPAWVEGGSVRYGELMAQQA